MGYKAKFSFFLLLLVLSAFSQFPSVHAGFHVDKISVLLSDKGYTAMSITLEMVLPSLIPPQLLTDNTTAVTIFCPADKAFLSSKYPQPPFTLLQYHVAPLKIDDVVLESILVRGSKIDTLLPGHPLVVTTITGSGQASINDVKIAEWDLYNDGQVIIHGVEDFFDPAFQTLRYPWYDGAVNGSKSGNDGSAVKGCSDEFGPWILWVKDKAILQVIGCISYFAFSCILFVFWLLLQLWI